MGLRGEVGFLGDGGGEVVLDRLGRELRMLLAAGLNGASTRSRSPGTPFAFSSQLKFCDRKKLISWGNVRTLTGDAR